MIRNTIHSTSMSTNRVQASQPPTSVAQSAGTSAVQKNAIPETKANSQAGPSNPSLTAPTDAKRTVALQDQLYNMYYFSKNDAENITHFIEAFSENPNEIKVEPTFRTKIKNLIAKIFWFFGNKDRAKNILQQEGIRLFRDLKTEIIKNPNKTHQMIMDAEDNSIQTGLFWILSPKLMALAKGDMENIPNLLKQNETARDLFAKEILSVTKEQLQESVSKNLQAKGKIDPNFLANNAIFKDTERGYAISFVLGNGQKIDINPGHGMKAKDEIFEDLKNQLNQQPKEMSEKIKKFCRGFSSQGIFSALHPFLPWIIQFAGNTHPEFTVKFFDEGKISVSVKVRGEAEVGRDYMLTATTLLRIPTETNCEFSFDYNLEDGSGKNVQVKNFQQMFHMNRLKTMDEMG